MLKKMNKKGFTLAELLIVVAIIAVLTAIAVPLFVSSLDKAEEAVFNSNMDVLRTAGVVKILSDDTIDTSTLDKTNNVMAVTGTFKKENGKWVLQDDVTVAAPAASSAATAESTFTKDWKGGDADSRSLTVWLKATDLNKAA